MRGFFNSAFVVIVSLAMVAAAFQATPLPVGHWDLDQAAGPSTDQVGGADGTWFGASDDDGRRRAGPLRLRRDGPAGPCCGLRRSGRGARPVALEPEALLTCPRPVDEVALEDLAGP